MKEHMRTDYGDSLPALPSIKRYETIHQNHRGSGQGFLATIIVASFLAFVLGNIIQAFIQGGM